MAAIVHPSLTNSQQLGVRPWSGRRTGLLAQFAATLRLWRRRIHAAAGTRQPHRP